MGKTTEWPSALATLEDKEFYSLKDLLKVLDENGFEVAPQSVYRWIRRRHIQKRGTISDPQSSQNHVVWLGADLKNATYKT